MYEKFFKLDKSPFGMTPDPSCLYMTKSHREALSGLVYAVRARKGFVVMTGDAGTGKTTLLRTVIRSCPFARFSVILNPTLGLHDFLELALLDFGISDVPAGKAQRIMRLQDFLVKLHEEGISPVLIIDEAHKLSPEVLEEVRLLTNFETSDQKLLQIVLAGQLELKALLNRSDLRQLKQRIEIRVEVRPLSAPDVATYMEHRWERAGGDTPGPFTSEAIAVISAASRGIPRLVNSICDNALLVAFGDEKRFVSLDHVREVLRDLDMEYSAPVGLGFRSSSNSQSSPNIWARTTGSAASRSDSAAIGTPEISLDRVATISNTESELGIFPTIERYIPPATQSWIGRLFGASDKR